MDSYLSENNIKLIKDTILARLRNNKLDVYCNSVSAIFNNLSLVVDSVVDYYYWLITNNKFPQAKFYFGIDPEDFKKGYNYLYYACVYWIMSHYFLLRLCLKLNNCKGISKSLKRLQKNKISLDGPAMDYLQINKSDGTKTINVSNAASTTMYANENFHIYFDIWYKNGCLLKTITYVVSTSSNDNITSADNLYSTVIKTIQKELS